MTSLGALLALLWLLATAMASGATPESQLAMARKNAAIDSFRSRAKQCKLDKACEARLSTILAQLKDEPSEAKKQALNQAFAGLEGGDASAPDPNKCLRSLLECTRSLRPEQA
ncbi:hypothetical protein CDD83_2470 [Cordyceps sp. RAO-2017]|nr:hypothetical protein CDD83_2470 [Cordyceps sp. RAO-2017]